MDEVGTIERTYPHLTPVQAAIELLQETWSSYQLWQRRKQFTKDYKFLGGAKDIEQAGLTFKASLDAHIYALTLHDLEKATQNGEISASDKRLAEHITLAWEKENAAQKQNAPEKLDAYQLGYEHGYNDGLSHKPQSPKPNALKATVSTAYREQFAKGYKDGHYAGVREARANELKRMRQLDRDNNRER